jgi:hypothetical protein
MNTYKKELSSIWKKFSSRYEVSDQGTVREIDTGSMIKKHKYAKGYQGVMLSNKQVPVHRLVAYVFLHLPLKEKLEVDHINKIRTDNRVSNLRVVTGQQNSRGAQEPRKHTSIYRGVFRRASQKNGKWNAQVKLNGKSLSAGLHSNEIDAAVARDRLAAGLGFPPEGLNFPGVMSFA